MTTGLRKLVLVTLALLSLSACAPGATADPLRPPLTEVASIQLPKEKDLPAFDLLTMDPRSHHLYVAHSSADILEIIDASSRRLAGEVKGLTTIKAIALTADPNVVFTSNGNGSVDVVDVNGLKVARKFDFGGGPDAIAYDPIHDVVLVSLSDTKKVEFIDVKTQTPLGTMALPGSPELMAVDQQTGTVYMAIHDKDEVVAIDVPSRSITKTFKGCDIKTPTGVAYDPDRGLLFVAGRAELAIVDVVIDQCRGAVDIGHGTDQITFNQHTHHVYTADTGSRYVSVVDSASLKPLGVVGTGPEAGGIATDPTTDLVYVIIGRAGVISVYHDP